MTGGKASTKCAVFVICRIPCRDGSTIPSTPTAPVDPESSYFLRGLVLDNHSEFTYAFVNLLCIGSPVAKNQAASRRRFQATTR